MDYKSKLKNNIIKNYMFIFINSMDLTQGFWMIYLASKGMSLMQLGIMEGIFHVTSFLMEVPTGAVADIYGRKTSRIIGRFFSLISAIIFISADSFYLFAVSFIIMAISYNLESGAGDALIYDSLKEIKEEDQYIKINGNQEMVMQIGTVIAFVLGGYLASKDYMYALVLAAFFSGIVLIQSFTFYEPHVKEIGIVEKNPFKMIKKQLKQSIKVIKGDRKIIFLILFSEIMGAFKVSMFFYLQNYWKSQSYTEFKIGIIFSASALAAAIVAKKTYKIEGLLKEKGILILMPILDVVCFFGISFTNISYIFSVLVAIIDTILYVVLSDYINKLIPSENRATILSLQSMVFSFYMIIIFPLIGKIGDYYSLRFAFRTLAVLGTILAVINTFTLKRGYGI
jgi:MFS family permease